MNLDATRSKHRVSRQDVRPTDFLSNTERDDRRMVDEQQKVADAIRTPILDQRALQLERLRIRNEAWPPDLYRSRQSTVQFSSACLMCDMNSSATAPSMIR